MKALETVPSLAGLADELQPMGVTVYRDMVFDEYFDEHASSSIITAYNNIDLYYPDDKLRCNQNIILEKKIGSGSFSDVYLAKLNGQPVALKILKQFAASGQHQAFEREIHALRRLLGNSRTLELVAYRPAPYYWIITKYMNQGTLASRLSNGPLSTEETLETLQQLALALLSLHQMTPPIFHRDVTTENTLFHDGQLRLGDFGVAVDFPSPVLDGLSPNGNPKYRAPEVRRGSPYDLSAEIYNFGSVLFEILAGRPPCVRQSFDINESDVHPGLLRLLNACWARNPADRPTLEQVLSFLEELQRAMCFE